MIRFVFLLLTCVIREIRGDVFDFYLCCLSGSPLLGRDEIEAPCVP